ncbi:MAG: molybdate ABC transporter substrate-binding protein [Acidobacteria bacterium]|nr:molybdate ABC transporter substrate-binding protein [Acidobacteriota bacterium]
MKSPERRPPEGTSNPWWLPLDQVATTKGRSYQRWQTERRAVRRRLSFAFCLLPFIFCLLSCATPDAAKRQPVAVAITVAAAADLASAFTELGNLFEQQQHIKVIFSFGSTGMLAKQIEQGFPADVFAAANLAFVDDLDKQGLIFSDSKAPYATGRITLWQRADAPLRLNRLEDLMRPEVKHIAIANPEHAPYGMAARQALQSLKLWNALQSKLVIGENVRQTLQYAETGNADVAITALSLSVSSTGRWTLIAEDLHRPLVQALAVIKSTSHEQAARQFAAFINSEQGRPIMKKYGFLLPGEEAAK